MTIRMTLRGHVCDDTARTRVMTIRMTLRGHVCDDTARTRVMTIRMTLRGHLLTIANLHCYHHRHVYGNAHAASGYVCHSLRIPIANIRC